MNVPKERRCEILLAALQERYTASHNIRARGMQFTLWISGLALALAWLLISEGPLTLSQCWSLTGLIAVLFAGTLYFVLALRRGFQNNRKAMINVEQALGMHESGAYLNDTPLLPGEYATTKPKWSDHFRSLFVWILLLGVCLLVLTWTNGHSNKERESQSTTIHTEGGK